MVVAVEIRFAVYAVVVFTAGADDGLAMDGVSDDVVVVVVDETMFTIPEAAFLKSKVPSGGPSGTLGTKSNKESVLCCGGWGL